MGTITSIRSGLVDFRNSRCNVKESRRRTAYGPTIVKYRYDDGVRKVKSHLVLKEGRRKKCVKNVFT